MMYNRLFFVLSLVMRHPKYVVREIMLRDDSLAKRRENFISSFSFIHLIVYPMLQLYRENMSSYVTIVQGKTCPR
jgi:hypothetical protein